MVGDIPNHAEVPVFEIRGPFAKVMNRLQRLRDGVDAWFAELDPVRLDVAVWEEWGVFLHELQRARTEPLHRVGCHRGKVTVEREVDCQRALQWVFGVRVKRRTPEPVLLGLAKHRQQLLALLDHPRLPGDVGPHKREETRLVRAPDAVDDQGPGRRARAVDVLELFAEAVVGERLLLLDQHGAQPGRVRQRRLAGAPEHHGCGHISFVLQPRV